jgi:hypothetical protein
MAAAPQPFPAEEKRELDEAGRSNELAAAAPPIAATAPRTAPMAKRQRAQAETPSAPPPSATPFARGAASRDDLRQRSEVAQSAAQSAPASTGAVGPAKTAPATDAAAKAVDVDTWIARIRKLHDDGRLADAAKELVALRAAVPDADRRLPPELHAWAATVKP